MVYKLKKVVKYYENLNIQLKSAIWLTISGFFQKAIMYLTTPIFTRMLSTQEYGLVAVYNSWFNILLIFTSLNLFFGSYNTAMIRFGENSKKYASSVLTLVFFSTISYYGIFYVLKDYIEIFSGFDLRFIKILFVQIFFQSSIYFWTEKKKFEFKYKPVVLLTILLVITTPLITIFALLSFEDLVYAKVLFNSIPIILIGLYTAYSIIHNGKTLINYYYWKFALRFNLPLLLHYLSTIVLGQSDRIMIAYMISESYAGIYSVAYSVGIVMTILTTSINQAFTPWFYNKLKDKKYDNIQNTIIQLIILVSAILMMLMIIAPELIKIMAPIEYIEAVWIIPPVATSVLFIFLYQIFGNVEFYYGKTKYMVVSSVLSALLNIGLNFMLIPIFGYLVAGYTTLVSYILFSLLHYYFAKRVMFNETKFWIFQFKKLYSISTLLIVFSILINLLYLNVYLRYSIIFSAIIAVYFSRRKIFSNIKRIYDLRER